MATVDELLSRARAHARAGQLAPAEESYRELLLVDPRSFQAHHELAIVLAHQGKLDDAVASLERVLDLHPEAADASANLRLLRAIQTNNEGIALLEQGKLDEAAEFFVRALELKPDYPEALCELGYVRLCQNRSSEAAAVLERVLELNPSIAEAHNHLGVALLRQGMIDTALVHHRRAVELKPGDADLQYNLAVALARRESWQEAADTYRRAIQLRPDHAESHNNLGVALARLGQTGASIAAYREAIKLKPDYAEAHTNLGAALVKQGDVDEAVAAHRRAVQLRDNNADAHYNLGIALAMQDRIEEAEHSYRRALDIRPDHAETWYNLAYVLSEQNEVERSAAACARALELRPGYADAHFSLAISLLLLGRLAEGWQYYEWRLKQSHNQRLDFSQPKWNGEPLDGRTILLVCEQGAGDAVQFIRYASLVKQRSGKVVVECAPQLAMLLATCPGVDQVVALGDPLPRFDVYAMLASMPSIFQTTLETIPADVPYLWPDQEVVERLAAPFRDEDGLKVGIAWQGNPANIKDRNRSIPLWYFEPLMQIPGVRLYSLQLHAGREQLAEAAADWPIVDLSEHLPGFLNTAAILRNLDLVITCDSAPAHLAGALGVPVWVALPHAPDWRWMLDRRDSPWYPTMRLFRQASRGDWAGVFQSITRELSELAASRSEAQSAAKQASVSVPNVPHARREQAAASEEQTERGISLISAGRLGEAESCFRRAIELHADNARAHGNLGNVMKRLGRVEEASRSYHRVLQIMPNSAEAMYSLGMVAREQERFAEAEDWCRRALESDEALFDAHYTLGAALLAQNKHAAAEQSFQRAIAIRVDSTIAHMGLAFTLLAQGRFPEGWAEYEWRLKDSRMADDPLDRPRWTGESLAGRSILLRCEQGFGDSLQFIRYAAILKRQGAKVIVHCRDPLVRILATCDSVDRVVRVGDPWPQFDVYIPLISLPSVIGTTLESVPVNIPYLAPEPELIERWKARLNSALGLKVGISWHCDPDHPVQNRRIPLARFAGIARTKGVRVYSLQFGAGREELNELGERLPIVDLGDELGDFHDTGAIMSCLDLIISCDSAPVHLAGALGIPVWVALPFAADWRWLLDRDDSPWYPKMRLFRQPSQGDWQSVFDAIEHELAKLVRRTSNVDHSTFLD